MCGSAGFGSVASGWLQGVGTIFQGRQQRDQYYARAAQDDADALYERQLGEVRASKVRKAGRIVKSQARVGFAGSGVEVGRGTPLAVNESIGRNVEEDALTQILTGERRATNLEKEAAGLREAGKNTTRTTLLSAWSSMLGGAGQAYNDNLAQSRWELLENRERRRSLYAGGMGTGMDSGGMGAYDSW